MNLSVAVIIATKGRPHEVSRLLEELGRQTIAPDIVVVSACTPDDLEQPTASHDNVEFLFGTPGLTAQRNRALDRLGGKYDIVIFFDDDFIPSRFWIERVRLLFANQAEVGTVTGKVLADGVTTGALRWPEGKAIVDDVDQSASKPTLEHHWTHLDTPYGCNMAFRASTIDGLTFDERLVLYGWLEDLDFGLRAGARARMIRTNLLWGVHLGVKGGRDFGLRFGYSQVVNPWYLMKKKVIKPFDAYRRIIRGFAGNAFMVATAKNSHFDRPGRLRGNIAGIKDILSGSWAPEKIAKL
ncbi:glycosyltransferase family 2 protein [Bradyrhizobium sp.]|uniref:glycosyltransferase family 2 protein n=1 Tax=Bradyrhizobium sp. TaxID=376 RepID=UPI0039E2BEEA